MRIVKEIRLDYKDVRNYCIKNKLYTQGSCADYEGMLNYVQDSSYDDYVLYNVACDIIEHSSTNHDIESLMFDLYRECVNVFFNVEFEEEV